jgi:hypothetical protein
MPTVASADVKIVHFLLAAQIVLRPSTFHPVFATISQGETYGQDEPQTEPWSYQHPGR